MIEMNSTDNGDVHDNNGGDVHYCKEKDSTEMMMMMMMMCMMIMH
jgi:hypothetical protein